jgi:peroxiredoxin
MIRRLLPLAAALCALAFANPASAELAKGAKAPTFATQGAEAGKAVAFNLTTALAKGPVVLYFYPKAFTQGCTAEAHAFAEATDDFHKAGATVIGMSADDLDTLKKFSTEACRDKFPVAIASPQVIQAYDVALEMNGKATGLTDRTTYVIGQDGRIAMAFSDLKPDEHIARSLAAVKALKN